MKMVSAAKLKRAQDAITQMRPYAGKPKEILRTLAPTWMHSAVVLTQQSAQLKRCRSLLFPPTEVFAGGFNSNINKQAMALANGDYAGKRSVLSIGKKSGEFLGS